MQSSVSSCRKIRANLLKNDTDISIGTVSSCLSKEFSLKSYKPAAKLRLISATKKKRLSFPNKHLYWTVENEEQFHSLTSLQFSSLQCTRGAFLIAFAAAKTIIMYVLLIKVYEVIFSVL